MHFTFHDIQIDVNTPTEAILENKVKHRFSTGEGFAMATINLDHLVKLRNSPDYTRAYAKQDIVVADGWPIVTLAKVARHKVELMPGSDMILPLSRWAADLGVKVALVGSTQEVLKIAKTRLEEKAPGLKVSLLHAPEMGFDPKSENAENLLRRLEQNGISLCFLALGAPKQEELAAHGRDLAPSVGFASIGAGLDFIAGQQKRAPNIWRRLKLEWLWRAMSNPVRLIPRYARCFAILPRELANAFKLRNEAD